MLDKLNVARIVAGHYGTLKDDRTGNRAGDLFVFYATPVIIAATLALFGIQLSDGAVNMLVSVLAVLAGLLLNLLVLLHAFYVARKNKPALLRSFAKQVHDNIAYAILVSLVSVIPLAVVANATWEPIRRWAAWIAIAFVVHFALTMLMILKRMYQLLDSEFGQ